MNQDLHDDALAAFRELRSPYASFYTAEIYKKLAMEELNNKPGQIQVGKLYSTVWGIKNLSYFII